MKYGFDYFTATRVLHSSVGAHAGIRFFNNYSYRAIVTHWTQSIVWNTTLSRGQSEEFLIGIGI